MMRSTRPLALLGSAALLTVTLAACSQGGGGEELSYEDSPLNEYMSAMWGGETDLSPEEQEKQFQDQQTQVEELTAECMAAEGFEYVPNTQNGGMMMSSSDEEWDPESEEWVAKYGYGVFTNPWGEEPMDPEEEYIDPNQDYVESLSESEQEAYYAVLYGESPTDEQAEDPDFDWSTLDMGCSGNASDEVYGSSAYDAIYEQFQPLMDRIQQLYETTQDAPEMSDLNAEWASCMADAGHTGYTAQMDAANFFYEEQNKFYEEQNALYEEFDWENASEEELAEMDAKAAEMDPSTSPEWEALAEQEIQVALADLECRDKTDFLAQSLQIQFDLEEQFIADNKADLEALKAAAEQAGS